MVKATALIVKKNFGIFAILNFETCIVNYVTFSDIKLEND